MKIIAFFNNKGGVGKTTLVYLVAWMIRELGHKGIAVELDPQSNLSEIFLPEEKQYSLFFDRDLPKYTIMEALERIAENEPYQRPHVEHIVDRLGLVVGDLKLSLFEEKLSESWLGALRGDVYHFKILTSIHRIITDAGKKMDAEYALLDLGPNLGAINRSALLAADYLVVPVGSDLFSLVGLENIGLTLENWKEGWTKRKRELKESKRANFPQQFGRPIGYVIMQYVAASANRPVKAYQRWADQLPNTFRKNVLQQQSTERIRPESDPNCLGLLKHYHSLAPLSMDARKPIFKLKASDGAIGSHIYLVQDSFSHFEELSRRIIRSVGLDPKRK